jgi:ribose transport system ATP-binding protein
MSAISKRFPGVVALDRVDFDVAAGEIVGLVGENGAGKSTLMKILGGIHRLDSGGIRIDGASIVVHGPADAARRGISLIHQELEVIDTLDVSANVFLGREPHRAGPLRLLDRRRMDGDTERLLARIGTPIPPRTVVARLSAAEQQFVALARALSMDARVLVLDEPTARLGARESERLHAVLADLRASGAAIVYISHRLREIEAIADRAVVLRDGRNAGVLQRGEITRDRLVQMMVGRRVEGFAADAARPGPAPGADRVRLQLDRVRTGRYPAAEVSLTVGRGEVLGIAGLIGAGRSELAEAICGVGTRLSGQVSLDGQALRIGSPREAIRAGLCLVPEDRRGCGIIATMSVGENITLPGLGSYARLGLVRGAAATRAASGIAATLGVKAASIEVAAGTLSGGNQQKVVLGKWLALRPKAVVFDEPTQGVDVGARAEIHRLILGLAEKGAAVVVISSDLDEILSVSDRVAVMHDGRVTGVLPRDNECTPEAIMRLAVA